MTKHIAQLINEIKAKGLQATPLRNSWETQQFLCYHSIKVTVEDNKDI